MSSIPKQIQGMRQLLSWGLVAITTAVLAPAARALPAPGASTEQDVLPDGRMYTLRYAERAFTAQQDLVFGLSIKTTTSEDKRVLPGLGASNPDAEALRLDARSQYLLDPHTVSAQLTYLRKPQTNTWVAFAPSYALTDWTASSALSSATEMINNLRKKFTYVYQGQFGSSVAFFQRSGTTYELFWTPGPNIRVGTQYTASRKFNSNSTNPGDNNTWFSYVCLTY